VQRSRVLALAGVLVFALAVRLLLLGAAAERVTADHPELETRDLSLLFDGRLYLLVARSFPTPYQSHGNDPVPVDFPGLTVYLPLLPAAIWSVDSAVGDLRTSAILASLLAACLTLLGFERLARRHLTRPLLATALFAVLPPLWVLVSVLPFSDSAVLAAATLAFAAFAARRHGLAVLAAGAAAIAQKNGFLVAAVLVLLLVRDEGWRGWRRIALYALAALPPLALQLYLYRVFGDPLVNVHATVAVWGGSPFALPGSMILEGLLRFPALGGGDPWPNRIAVAVSLVFYAGALWVSRRDNHVEARPLRTWLLVVLGFNLVLGGTWSYYDFPRHMLLAAPPALLLWLRRFESRLQPATAGAVLAGGVAFSFWYGLESVSVAVRVLEKVGVFNGLVKLRELFF
jgi:hypothetical protein